MLTSARGARALIRASAASPRTGSRPTSTSRAPLAASRSAVTSPIPEVAPVMTQSLPSMPAIGHPHWRCRHSITVQAILVTRRAEAMSMTPHSTLPALLDRHLAERPDAPAFIDGERPITHAEFDALCCKTAAWLTAQGVRCGDRVAVWLVNRVEWLALLFGLARIGAALVAVNTRFRAAELEHVLRRSGARMLVIEPTFKKIDFAAIRAGSAAPRGVLGKPTVAFDAFERSLSAAPDRSDPEAIVALFTTSGTTKGPKLVMHPQRSIAYHARAVARGFGLETADSRVLAAIPFCGVFGFDLVLGALAAGAPAVIMDTFEARAAVELVTRHKISHLFGSDEMARRMMELAPGRDPFPHLRLFGYAAFQPGSAELGKAGWERRIPLVGLYGSSEAQALFAFLPLALPLEQRIEPGGLPGAGADAEIRLRDVDSGELVEIGRSGEIEIRA